MFDKLFQRQPMQGHPGFSAFKRTKPPLLQTKLSVNEPNDKYEQEADRIADKIVNMKEDEPAGRKPATSAITPLVQTKRENGPVISPASSDRISASLGGGSSLEGDTGAFMSGKFGTDFSKVRIHADQEAAEMNREIHSRAFTVGNDIFFNSGEYSTGNDKGRLLLAHELTHTLQQKNSEMVMRQGGKEEKKEEKPAIDFHILPPDFKLRLHHLVFEADTSAVQLDLTTKSLKSSLSYKYGGPLALKLGDKSTSATFGWQPGQNDLSFKLSQGNLGLGLSASPGAGKYGASLHFGDKLLPMPSDMSKTFMSGGTAGASMLGDLPNGVGSPLDYYQQHKSDIEDITKSVDMVKKITDAGKKRIRFGADLSLSYDPVNKTVFTVHAGAQLLF